MALTKQRKHPFATGGPLYPHQPKKKTKAQREKEKYRRTKAKKLPLRKEGWNKLLAELGLSMSRGQFLTDAPTGRGELVSGGYSSEKVSRVYAAASRGHRRLARRRSE